MSNDDKALFSELFSAEREREVEPDKLDTPAPAGEPPAAPAEVKEPEAVKPPADTERVRDTNGKYARSVPLAALEEERTARKTLAAERDAVKAEKEALEARIAELTKSSETNATATLQRRIDELDRRTAPAKPEARQAAEEIPDPVLDPAGYADYHRKQDRAELDRTILSLRLDRSEDRARAKYGDEIVDKAFEAAKTAGAIPHFRDRTADCYDSIVKWHRQQETLKKVGDDPAAYETKLAERIRAELLADLKAGKVKLDGTITAAPSKTPAANGNLPTSLADATSAGPAGNGALAPSDKALARELFSSDRHAQKRA